MEIKATINVARIVEAMASRNLKVVDVCALCGINSRTLAKILRGQFPQRLDSFYRLVNGLHIPMKEALIAGTSEKARLQLVPGGRLPPQVA